MNTTNTRATSTCPAWCHHKPHDPWLYDDVGAVIERTHERNLCESDGVRIYLAAPERLTLDMDAIAAGARIDSRRFEQSKPAVHFDIAAGTVGLSFSEIRRLVAALTTAIATIDADMVTTDPLDEAETADRIAGSGVRLKV